MKKLRIGQVVQTRLSRTEKLDGVAPLAWLWSPQDLYDFFLFVSMDPGFFTSCHWWQFQLIRPADYKCSERAWHAGHSYNAIGIRFESVFSLWVIALLGNSVMAGQLWVMVDEIMWYCSSSGSAVHHRILCEIVRLLVVDCDYKCL